MGKFSDDVKAFTVEVQESQERIIRGTVISLYRDIIFSSPVDTGRFRGNWFLSGENPSNKITTKTDESGQKTVNKMTEGVLSAIDFSVFTLTNNLPYSEVIEYGGYKKGGIRLTKSKITHEGFSKQAPKGVVGVNTLRFNALLEKEAKKDGYERI